MSTTITSLPRAPQPSEPEEDGPITELGPLEPQTPAQRIQTIADFQPTERLAEQILTDASNPSVSLHLIAERARTTIEALQAWLARPEIIERLETINQSIRQRSRLKISHELDGITEACATILERFNRAPDRGSTPDQRSDTELRASSIITRNASNALMASRVLLALANYLDRPPRAQRTHQSPTAPKTNPTPNLDPSLRLTPTELTKAFRILPSLASVDLHDFREYLTSNHHHNGHTVQDLTPHAGDEALRIPGSISTRITPPIAPPFPSATAFQHEVLNASSRVWSESASDTSGRTPADSSHLEEVLVPPNVPQVRRGSERQPVPTTNNLTTTQTLGCPAPAHEMGPRRLPATPVAGKPPPRVPARETGGRTPRQSCACGPTSCTICPSARSRYPTTP